MTNFYQKKIAPHPQFPSRWQRQNFTSSLLHIAAGNTSLPLLRPGASPVRVQRGVAGRHSRNHHFIHVGVPDIHHASLFTLPSSLFLPVDKFSYLWGIVFISRHCPRAMFFDNQIPYHIHPADTVRHIVGLYLDMCPKRPKIGGRTLCRSYAQTLSDFPSKGVRNLAVGQHRTRCQTLPQHVSEKSENRQLDTVSNLCSNTVRFYLKGCPKIAGR